MDRYWFFTWRTYGTWLPGEDGFVGYYRRFGSEKVIDNRPNGDFAKPMPALTEYARQQLKSEPVYLKPEYAPGLIEQFRETATIRQWQIDAIAILVDHIHVVFGVPGDPDPSEMLDDWKAYASRHLNQRWMRRTESWWVVGGSKRRLKSDRHRWAAIRYVRDQRDPLVVWLSDEASAMMLQPAPD